jgi:MotA/TolQ/ExbB proton channel family
VELIFSITTIAIFAFAVLREICVVLIRIKEEEKLIKFLANKDTPRDDKYEDKFRECKKILARPIPKSGLNFVPSVLTSTGLLGTFLGIQIALANLDPKNIQAGVDTLLSGMKTAFTSSLFGLGCAAIFIVCLAFSTYIQNRSKKSLRRKLFDINYKYRFDKDVSTELINAAEKMQSLNSKSIGVEVGEALIPIFREIRTELKSLREFKADRGQDILKELKDEFILPISDQLKESAISTKEASEAVISLKNELGGVSEKLAASIVTIQNFQGNTLSQLEGFANNLGNTLVDFQTGTKGVLKEVGEEIKRGVDESILGMKAQREAFSDSATQAAKTFTGIRTELEAALTTQTESQERMLQNVENRMNTILLNTHQAFEQQSNTLELVGEKASTLMDTAKDSLLGTLGNIDVMLQKTRQTVQNELNNFRETYQESLDTFFNEQNNLLGYTLDTQRQGLSDIVIELKTAFQEEAERRKQLSQQLDENLAKIQYTAGVVSKLVNTVGLHDGAHIAQMQELSQNMGAQVNNLERSYRNLNTRYEESLRIGNEQLSEYFQRAIVHEQKFFEEADSSTAKLCNTLLKAADYLVATEKSRRQEQGDN